MALRSNHAVTFTDVIYFHQAQYRNFKAFYQKHILADLWPDFPDLVSYSRCVEFRPSVLMALCAYLRYACLGTCTGISFLDSTALAVCDNHRIYQQRVFREIAQRGKTSTG
jgi:hypothetical protein